MVLHVTYESFADTVKKELGQVAVYISPVERGAIITAAHPTMDRMVACRTSSLVAEATKSLAKKGFEVLIGAWLSENEIWQVNESEAEAHVAGMAYISEDGPGIWLDAFPEPPSDVQVLRAAYDEFRATGELGEVSFEEFVRLANPRVATLSPADVSRYMAEKGGC